MHKKTAWIIIVSSIFLIAIIAAFFTWRYYAANNNQPSDKATFIPESISNNKFGFLVAGTPESINDEDKIVIDLGAAWVRPHPGPFVWGNMQKEKDADIKFADTDAVVKTNQTNNIGTLVTLWPYADWDQKNHSDSEQCKVADNDEFLANDDKGDNNSSLPQYRCNPSDWDAYRAWVSDVVERYDGDGIDDMPGLKIPVKYWEVMNEPDLQPSNNNDDRGMSSLQFYTQDSNAYANLLINTSNAIRSTDSNAKVLIAGAAGGSNQFLNFYKSIFKNNKAIAAFDIANIHCISNDDIGSLNVALYKDFLESFGLNKPIWVTEAETMTSGSASANALQLYESTQSALALGAQKIFFTRFNFGDSNSKKEDKTSMDKEKSAGYDIGSTTIDNYQKITNL